MKVLKLYVLLIGGVEHRLVFLLECVEALFVLLRVRRAAAKHLVKESHFLCPPFRVDLSDSVNLFLPSNTWRIAIARFTPYFSLGCNCSAKRIVDL